MDTAQWPEGIGVVKSMEEKKSIRPQKPQALNCPRCNSTHTKFCYYNNYSLSQPRYFCKTCRRYWTEGGSLRNVPVGGGSRKNKRSSSSSSSSSSAAAVSASSTSKNHHHMMMGMAPPIPSLISQNPSKNIIPTHGGGGQGQDLNLAYPNVPNEFVDLSYHPNTTTTTCSSSQFSAMEFLKNGIGNSRGMIMNPFMSNTMIMSSPAGLNFSLDGFENGGGYHHQHHNTNNGISLQGGDQQVINHQDQTTSTTTTTTTTTSARPFFPFEDLKQISTSTSEVLEPNRGGQGDSSNGYWNGGLGGGSW